MKYFQMLTLIDQMEMSSYFIWSKVYTQLHLALVEHMQPSGNNKIGISFPDYQFNPDAKPQQITLGNKLRIFAHEETELQQLNISRWLSRLSDYVHCTSIRTVPAKTGYALFSRYQPTNHSDRMRLARRQTQRDPEIKLDTALQNNSNQISMCSLPFVRLTSLSKKQLFPLFVRKQIVDAPQTGTFSSYGLSSHTTVPDF